MYFAHPNHPILFASSKKLLFNRLHHDTPHNWLGHTYVMWASREYHNGNGICSYIIDLTGKCIYRDESYERNISIRKRFIVSCQTYVYLKHRQLHHKVESKKHTKTTYLWCRGVLRIHSNGPIVSITSVCIQNWKSKLNCWWIKKIGDGTKSAKGK